MGSSAARKRASRQKTKQAAPTSSQAATWGSPKTTIPSFDPASRAQLLQGWQSFPTQERSFTLSQEARNTHRSAWNESNRLRDSAIRFVSGGNLKQDDPGEDKDQDEADMERVGVTLEAREKVPLTGPSQVKGQTDTVNEYAAKGVSATKVDLTITEQVQQMNISGADASPSDVRRRSISASSSSSGEVILFAGRGNPQKKRKHYSPKPTPQFTTPDSLGQGHRGVSPLPEPLALSAPSRLKPDAAEFVPIQSTNSASRYSLRSQGVLVPGGRTQKQTPSTNPGHQRSSNSQRRQGRSSFLDSYDDGEEILRDYIENVKETENLEDGASSGESESPHNHEAPHLGDGRVKAISSTVQAKVNVKDAEDDWSSEDLRDFDELDTSEDDLTDIGGVFSRRKRPSGVQYLVTPMGQSTDFAKWILHKKLTSIKVRELILNFEETHPERPEGSEDNDDDGNQWDDSASDDSDEEALNDLTRDQESEHNENERILNHTSQMTDAELARILNKQAELGIDSDDVVLFDDAAKRIESFVPFSIKKHTSNRTRAKRIQRSRDTFPSAEAFADVLDQDPYNGFDVMDFERPSLKPKKKGRKSANGLPFELEDDELAEQLAQSWANDRSKKTAKKAEREELRQAGLLGPKSGKGRVDLQTKYKNNGMDMDQVKAEIRLFLLDEDREALALASMSSPQRAQVHLLAKALHLQSHSQGKGDTRFPILTKTPFSGRYDEDNITEIDALLAKRKFSTSWGKKEKAIPRSGGGRAKRSGGGGVAAGATYMDGDVVGASAPELGSDNRGRAMLEKMGWSSGMGIGKVGNKGSVEVIKHVVKNSKAGLG